MKVLVGLMRCVSFSKLTFMQHFVMCSNSSWTLFFLSPGSSNGLPGKRDLAQTYPISILMLIYGYFCEGCHNLIKKSPYVAKRYSSSHKSSWTSPNSSFPKLFIKSCDQLHFVCAKCTLFHYVLQITQHFH